MEAASKEYGQQQNQEKEPCKEKTLSVWDPTCILLLGHPQTAGLWQKDGIFSRKKEQPLRHTGSWSAMPGKPHEGLPCQICLKREGWKASEFLMQFP